MLKIKMKNKVENYTEKEGIKNVLLNEDDKANQSRKEELEIKTMIKKYGVLPFEFMNTVKEPIFMDMRGEELTINQRLKQKEEIDTYFDSMPANIRENYHHNKEEFYQKLVNGEFEQLQKDGVVTDEHVQKFNEIKNQKDNKIYELTSKINELQNSLNLIKNNGIGEIKNEIQSN